jgi:hypothetical protein
MTTLKTRAKGRPMGLSRTATPKWALRSLALMSGASLLLGCEPEIHKPKPSVRSNVVVPLPPSPELVRKPYEKVNKDGTLTVEGILRERATYIGEGVTVRGVVKKLVKCPEVPPEPAPEPVPNEKPKAPGAPGAKDTAELAPPPPPRPPRTCSPPPHFFLVDKNPVSRRELLVYGSMWSVLPALKEGAEVTLAGQFDIVSKDGVFLRQAGLLILDDLPEVMPTPDAPPGDAPPGGTPAGNP